jgi:hypothetical protein
MAATSLQRKLLIWMNSDSTNWAICRWHRPAADFDPNSRAGQRAPRGWDAGVEAEWVSGLPWGYALAPIRKLRGFLDVVFIVAEREGFPLRLQFHYL